MWSPSFHSTNRNGPVPTGFRPNPFPDSWAAFALTIVPARPVEPVRATRRNG